MTYPLDGIAQLAPLLPPTGALLGFDVGSKRIGLSVSDRERIVATPLLALTRTSFADLAAAVQDLSADRQVCAFIVGLPLNMNGTEGPRCQASRAFARNLAGKLGLPTTYWDERLSTAEAERHLIAGDLSRRRRRQLVDKVAAALILQSALDRLQQLRPRP